MRPSFTIFLHTFQQLLSDWSLRRKASQHMIQATHIFRNVQDEEEKSAELRRLQDLLENTAKMPVLSEAFMRADVQKAVQKALTALFKADVFGMDELRIFGCYTRLMAGCFRENLQDITDSQRRIAESFQAKIVRNIISQCRTAEKVILMVTIICESRFITKELKDEFAQIAEICARLYTEMTSEERNDLLQLCVRMPPIEIRRYFSCLVIAVFDDFVQNEHDLIDHWEFLENATRLFMRSASFAEDFYDSIDEQFILKVAQLILYTNCNCFHAISLWNHFVLLEGPKQVFPHQKFIRSPLYVDICMLTSSKNDVYRLISRAIYVDSLTLYPGTLDNGMISCDLLPSRIHGPIDHSVATDPFSVSVARRCGHIHKIVQTIGPVEQQRRRNPPQLYRLTEDADDI